MNMDNLDMYVPQLILIVLLEELIELVTSQLISLNTWGDHQFICGSMVPSSEAVPREMNSINFN